MPSTPTTASDQLDATGAPPEPAPGGQQDGWLLGVVFVLVALGVVGVAAWLASRRRTGRARDDRSTRNAEVAAVWVDAVRALALVDLRPASSETPLQFARRCP